MRVRVTTAAPVCLRHGCERNPLRVLLGIVVRGGPVHSTPFLPSTIPCLIYIRLAGGLVVTSVGLRGHGAATPAEPRLAEVGADDGAWIR